MAEGGERKGEEEEISSYENFPIPPPPFSLSVSRTNLTSRKQPPPSSHTPKKVKTYLGNIVQDLIVVYC